MATPHRLIGVVFALIPVVLVGLVLRVALVFQSPISWSDMAPLTGALVWGLFADLVYAGYAAIPLVLYLAIAPQRLFRSRANAVIMWLGFAVTWWVVLLTATADWLFWEEFAVRPNFIAVDYLIYTTEVIDNILESYPIALILLVIFTLALLATAAMTSQVPMYGKWLRSDTPARSRLAAMAALLLIPVVTTAFISERDTPEFDNNYVQEIAKNGQYSFFAAFRNNELDYRKFYEYRNEKDTNPRIRELVREANIEFETSIESAIRRAVYVEDTEHRPNVIQITVESLSADFLGVFGNESGLTPNLDRLSNESLFFTNFMATGTRTVRGMESLTLSVPPTPGRSIVKRPENSGMFNIGEIFASKGYKTSFMYGGRGYFDNMNAFFSGNGFSIHDQNSEHSGEVEFTNAWGVSDEDLYDWVIAEADKSAAAGKPFYQFVMTTSNHRPFTYPEGRIDIPSHSGRKGAVKYTDYAIGKFIEEARTKPWFDNTVFVIVSDHCASSAGKTDLPVENYHIPLLVYAPAMIEPRRIDTLSSQIDYAPTLFALLGWSYESEFFGKNILALDPDKGRAVLGSYQHLGLLENGLLTVLKPFRKTEAYLVDLASSGQVPTDVDQSELLNAVAYYQTAADDYDKYVLRRAKEKRNN